MIDGVTIKEGSGSSGSGIYNGGGNTLTRNTILANNRAGVTANDCSRPSGAVTSGGYNLVQVPGNCVFATSGDITGTNPLLAPLADNGGATLTQALLEGSPAIDKIPNGSNGCGTTLTSDQRGVVRPQGPACDVGAYEVGGLFDLFLPVIIKN